MMNLFRKLLKKSHRQPSIDDPGQEPVSIPKGRLGSYADNGCQDVIMRELPPGLILPDAPVFVAYFESLIKVEILDAAFHVINGLLTKPKNLRPDETSGGLDVKRQKNLQDAVQSVLDGWTVFVVPSGDVYTINT